MSNYRLNINGKIEESDYDNIYDYFSILGDEDELTISLLSKDNANINIIYRLLTMNGFNIRLEEEKGRKYKIKVVKN
jgi:hypothetical protein